jgi:MFS family permease
MLRDENLEPLPKGPNGAPLAAGGDARVDIAALAGAIATVSIVGIGLSLTMTLIAVRLGEQGYSARAIGLNPTAAGLATLISAAFVPLWAQRFGVRRVLFLALLTCVLSLAGMAAKDNYWSWLAIRAVFGAALTALFVVSEYWINAIAPPGRRGFVIGFYATSVALGFAVGPSILALVGTASAAPFFAAGLLFALAAAPILAGSGAEPAIKEAPRASVFGFLLAAPIAALAGLLHGAIETAGMGLLPVYALRADLPAETGAFFVSLFAFGNVLFQLPIGYVSDHVNRGAMLLAITVFGLCGAILLGLGGVRPFVVFCGLLLVWGGVVGSFYAVALAQLGDRFKGGDLARANAAFVMLYSIGMLIGAPIAGFGMDLWGPSGFFFTIGAMLALYLCAQIRARRSKTAAAAWTD